MKKVSLFALAAVLALVLTAPVYAGEGSDTVGDGKILPELRYSYSQTDLHTNLLLLNTGEYELTQHDIYVQLNWGVHPNLDIYGLAGARIESLDADVIDSPLLGMNINAGYDNAAAFLYGLGVKATFYRGDNGFYVGGGVLFTHSFGEKTLKLSGEALGVDIGALTEGVPTKIKTSMITLTPDLHVGWHFKNIGLTPYAGIEYRRVWAEASYDIGQVVPIAGDVTINFEQEDGLGLFAGLDYRVNDRLSFNVEGNFLNRWGVNAGVGYLFDINENPNFVTNELGGGGAGSDTIGDCRVLPQVRYSYMQTKIESDFPLLNTGEYTLTQHDIYVQLNWGVHPNLDIYGLAGARIGSLDADVIDSPLLGMNINAGYDNAAAFLYGVGVKGTFYRAENGFYIGGGVLFTHSFGEETLKLSGEAFGADIGDLTEGVPTKIKTSMITLTPDIHAGWHFKNIGLTPYVGIEYRRIWADAAYEIGQVIPIDGDVTLNFDQKDGLGLYAGIDYRVGDRLSLNVEGNFLNRWGVSAGIGYLFDICEKPKPAAPAPAPEIAPTVTPMSKN